MQRMCVGWFRLQYPAVGKLLFAVPNGGARSRTEAAIMKAEGVTAGVTDLILLLGRGGFNALCIEMKTTDRRSALSDAQIEWRSLTITNGNRHVVCRTLEEFQSEIRWYMARPANNEPRDEITCARPIVPLYEGDIINWLMHRMDRTGYIEEGRVEFRTNEQATVVINKFATKDGRESVRNILNCLNDLKVIGNIHDNPELMKGGDQ